MPDSTITQELIDLYEAGKQKLNEYNDGLKEQANIFDSVQKAAGDYLSSIKGVIGDVKEVSSDFGRLNQLASENAVAINAITLATFKAGDGFKILDENIKKSTGFSTYADQWKDFISKTRDMPGVESIFKKIGLSEENIKEAKKEAKEGESVLEATKRYLISYTSDMTKMADQQKGLQELLMMRAGESGFLDELKQRTQGFRDLNELAYQHGQIIHQVQDATGASEEKAIEYYKTIASIPEMTKLTANITGTSTKDMVSSIGLLSEGSKIPIDTFKSALDSARNSGNILAHDFENAGNNVVGYLASMVEASNKLKIEFSLVAGYTKAVAESFKYFGDEGAGSLKIMNDLMGALRGTGLSAQNSQELILGMTKQIGQLTEAQKAFISQQTGGPGGLQGAFDIDYMLRQGKIYEVMQKVRETLSQQMGPLVTLEEARGSEESAQQYQRQLMMLRQGPLGSFASSQEGAERLIDAMKKAQEGNVAPLQEAADSYRKYADEGKSYRDRNATFMSEVSRDVDKIRGHLAYLAYNTQMSALGMQVVGGKQTFTGTTTEANLFESDEVRAERQRRETQAQLISTLTSKTQIIQPTAGESVARGLSIARTVEVAASSATEKVKKVGEEIGLVFGAAVSKGAEVAKAAMPKAKADAIVAPPTPKVTVPAVKAEAPKMPAPTLTGIDDKEIARRIEVDKKATEAAMQKIMKENNVAQDQINEYIQKNSEKFKEERQQFFDELIKTTRSEPVAVQTTPATTARPGTARPATTTTLATAAPSAMDVVHHHKYELYCVSCTNRLFKSNSFNLGTV